MARTQEERSEATRAILVTSGRKLFGTQGFNKTSIDQIVQEAKVTKGALYHHFDGKNELFVAVTEQIEGEVLKNTVGAIRPADPPWAQIESGILHFLDECVHPEIQQILVHDGPIVMGWERSHYSERRTGVDTACHFLVQIEGLEELQPETMSVLANMFTGTLMEAAKTIANAENPEKARAFAYILIKSFIKSIRESATALAASQ
jgi:AcrR family transcriptional regulator